MTARPDMKPALNESVTNTTLSAAPSGAQVALDPFSDAQIEGLFFPGAGRQETLEQLQHLLRYGPALLVLDGDEGVGKQFLINRMLSTLDPELFELALIQANVLNSPDAISSALSAAWNCPQDLTLQNRQQVLTSTAQAADNESKTLLAIVRQAQHLGPESCLFLRELLAITAGLPVKFLLVVDAVELESVGYLYELISQVPDNFQLTLYPFSLEESKEYLAYRLRTAGLGQVRFNDDQIKQIFNHSLGNVQQINDMAGELLKSNLPSPQPKKPPSNLPKMHLVAVGLMVVVLLTLVLFRGNSEHKLEHKPEHKPEPDAVAQAPISATASSGTLETPPALEASAENTQEITQEITQENNKANTAAESEKRLDGDAPGATQPASEPLPEKEVVQSEEVSDQIPQESPVDTETRVAQPSAEKSILGVTESTEWVLALPKDQYVMQLLGAKEWKTVETFVKRYKDVKNLAYYKMMRQGVPWYVVLQGSFPDHDAASAAVKTLPASLQKQGPWIRKVEVIQGELKN